MSKAYRKMADQLLREKVQKEFPDWELHECKISTGEVFLCNDDADISLYYHPDKNTFELVDVTLHKTNGVEIMVDNEKLTEIYTTIVKGVKPSDNSPA